MLSHRGRAPRPLGRRREVGETLIEVMVSILLMGTVISAVLGGLFALVVVSDRNEEFTQVSVAVQTYAEQIKQPVEDLEYIPCGPGTPAAYQAKLASAGVAEALPDSYPAPTIKVTYWQGGSGFSTSCPAPDKGLQRFEITVTNGRTGPTGVTETLLVVKRNTKCPQEFDNPDAGPC